MIAVTKSVGMDVVRCLLDMGLTDLAENRPLEFVRRVAMVREIIERRKLLSPTDVPSPPAWHMVGHLQRNKVKPILPFVKMIHSVDSLRLVEEINKRAEKLGICVDVLLEVNGGNEPQKHGTPVCAAPHLGEQIAVLPHLRLRGLMTMAPLGADEITLGHLFSRVWELFEEMKGDYEVGDAFDTYSAGMSNDFETAIEFGATTVRIGSALFEGIDRLTSPSPDSAATA